MILDLLVGDVAHQDGKVGLAKRRRGIHQTKNKKARNYAGLAAF